MKIDKYETENQSIIEDLEAFNQGYIQKFIDLYTHRTVVDADFYIAAQKALTEQYESELELKRRQSYGETQEKYYLADRTASVLSIYSYRPRFSRRWRSSRIKKALDERIADEVRGHLDDLNCGLEQQEDEVSVFIDRLVEEFVPKFKRNHFMRRYESYLMWLLTEAAVAHSVAEIFSKLIKVLTTPRKREKFLHLYGEYILNLLSELLQKPPVPAPEPKKETQEQNTPSEPEPQTLEQPEEETDSGIYENGGIDLDDLDDLDAPDEPQEEPESTADAEPIQQEISMEEIEEHGADVDEPEDEEDQSEEPKPDNGQNTE